MRSARSPKALVWTESIAQPIIRRAGVPGSAQIHQAFIGAQVVSCSQEHLPAESEDATTSGVNQQRLTPDQHAQT